MLRTAAMTQDEAIALVRKRWNADGACCSCGWHAALYEYGDLGYAIDIYPDHIRLTCLNESGDGGTHRGVRIYFEDKP